MSSPRGVEARLDWMTDHPPGEPGWCIRECWHALGGDQNPPNPPAWGTANANEAYDKAKASGRWWTSTPIPRGALILWKYGANGHAALSNGDGTITTTDPTGSPGGVGVEDLTYPHKWGANAHDRGWTDSYSGVRFAVGVDPGPVYVDRLFEGSEDSDSVRRLQQTLNGISLAGGAELPITGGYFDMTKAEVAKWQQQKATDKDVTDGVMVTNAQADQLFAGTGNTVIHAAGETPPTQPPPETGDEEKVVSTFGLYKWYSGKLTDELRIYPDGAWHKICKEMAPSNITAESSEHHFLYLRIALPSNRTASRTIETHWRRSDGDETAYFSPEWTADAKDSIAYFNHHMEDGSGLGGQWYIKVTGGTDPIVVTTRYAKTHVFYQDKVTVLVSELMTSLSALARSLR